MALSSFGVLCCRDTARPLGVRRESALSDMYPLMTRLAVIGRVSSSFFALDKMFRGIGRFGTAPARNGLLDSLRALPDHSSRNTIQPRDATTLTEICKTLDILQHRTIKQRIFIVV